MLRVDATLENLDVIRNFVEKHASEMGLGADATYGLILAADEAATNIIVHGYKRKAGTIEVWVEREGDTLIVRLHDDAPPFDPTRVPAPDLKRSLEKRKPGGLGIFFIRHYTDEAVHRNPPEGGNELILKKKMSGGDQ